MRTERQLWICGDIHGELSGLVRNAVNRGISCADIDLVDPLSRKSRQMINDSLIKFGSSKRVWWPDEAPSTGSAPSASSGTLFPETADIVVSHEAPLSFEPLLMRADYVRDETWLKIVESRKYLDYLLQTVKPTLWLYGHYHCHYEGEVEFAAKNGEEAPRKTRYQCLDIAEMTRVV